MKRIDAKGKRVLIIPDLHIPFHHPDSFAFLKAIKDALKDPDLIVLNLGDEIDGNQLSFHQKDPDMPFSPSSELEKAIEYVADLQKIFPQMHLCESNHGSLVYRRQKFGGIPAHCMKSYSQILDAPNWHWHEDILVDTNLGDIYLCHGKTSSAGKLSKEMGCSSIQGHYHGKFQIMWNKTATRDTFDAYSGCLIDRQSLAFAYGKNHIPKPILGCLLISKMGYPRLIKMVCNDKGRWIRRLP